MSHCRCGSSTLADDVERIRTFYTDGSSLEHGREYCATGGPAFWNSVDHDVKPCVNRTDAMCLSQGCFNTQCPRFDWQNGPPAPKGGSLDIALTTNIGMPRCQAVTATMPLIQCEWEHGHRNNGMHSWMDSGPQKKP